MKKRGFYERNAGEFAELRRRWTAQPQEGQEPEQPCSWNHSRSLKELPSCDPVPESDWPNSDIGPTPPRGGQYDGSLTRARGTVVTKRERYGWLERTRCPSASCTRKNRMRK